MMFAYELAVVQADLVGCVGIVVDAKADAVGFYRRFGFTDKAAVHGGSKARPRQTPLFLSLPKIRAALDAGVTTSRARGTS